MKKLVFFSLSIVSVCLAFTQSDLENYYSQITTVQLEQYGYSFFGSTERAEAEINNQQNRSQLSSDSNSQRINDTGSSPQPFANQPLPQGSLPNFESSLKPGDQLNVYLWGDPISNELFLNAQPGLAEVYAQLNQLRSFFRVVVEPDGGLFFPLLGRFSVNGISVNELENIIRESLQNRFPKVEIAIGLAELNQFLVAVNGFVGKPGMVPVHDLSTVMDALIQAQGIEKQGSLRNIRLIRTSSENRQIIPIDLYQVLIYGEPNTIRLQPGDSIIVPGIGTSVGIEGPVNRPGIYELVSGEDLSDLVDYAGGFMPLARTESPFRWLHREGALRISVREAKWGEEQQDFLSGDLIQVPRKLNELENYVRLSGHVLDEGLRAWTEGLSLGDLVPEESLLEDTDLLRGDIIRTNLDGTTDVISFQYSEILTGKEILLQPKDEIYFYPRRRLQFITVSGGGVLPRTLEYENDLDLWSVIGRVELQGSLENLKVEIHRKVTDTSAVLEGTEFQILREDQRNIENNTQNNFNNTSPLNTSPTDIYQQDTQLTQNNNPNLPLTVLRESAAQNRIVSEQESDIDIMEYLGSDLVQNTNGQDKILLEPGDRVYFLPLSEHQQKLGVWVIGAVGRPGKVFLERGASIQDALAAAGGYGTTASQGNVFFFREELESSQNSVLASYGSQMIREYNQSVAILLSQTNSDTEYFGLFAERIRQEDLGRMVIPGGEANWDKIPVVQNDWLYFPSVPSTVSFLGAVTSQVGVTYQPGWSARRYLESAVGLDAMADISRASVIKLDGTVYSTETVGNLLDRPMDPGDTVIVPYGERRSTEQELNFWTNVVTIITGSVTAIATIMATLISAGVF